jgi:hypothetical protein
MWVVGFQSLPYVGQNTNATIESDHGTLKAQLKSRKSILVGRCVDWCICVHPYQQCFTQLRLSSTRYNPI